MLGLFVAMIVFFSGSNYTRLQFNTGIRYMAPLFPFLFVPAASVLVRLPPLVARVLGVLAVAQGWSMAMYRDVEQGLGVFDPILHVFLGGLQLPALSRLARMEAYARFFEFGPSPIPLFLLAAALLGVIWTARRPSAS